MTASSSHQRALITGSLFALAAGLMWGLVFIVPLLLPGYPALLLSVSRYLAFGLIALPLAWLDRRRLRALTRSDWLAALQLSAVGNLLYYLCLAEAIQRAGGPLPTMIIGTLPVVIATVANLRGGPARQRDGRLQWRRLAPSLLLIAAGIGCVNHAELQHLRQLQQLQLLQQPQQNDVDFERYASGALLALAALACWTWYPIRNADWLRAHAGRPPGTWATAQGLATLPLSAIGFATFWLWNWLAGNAGMDGGFTMPLGPTPALFLLLMFATGLFASWLGTLCWNEASQRLPPLLSGQLIVFETLSALAYAFVLRGQWPAPVTLLGIALLLAGVLWGLRQRPA